MLKVFSKLTKGLAKTKAGLVDGIATVVKGRRIDDDVLDELEEIKICTGYEYKGKMYYNIPGDPNFLDDCEPVYETHQGWQQDTSSITSSEDLPVNARKYLDRIRELIGTDIMLVSVGKSRKQTLVYK